MITNIKVGKKNKIGIKEPVYIIAEAGVNHNGDVNIAKKLIRGAKQIGADCIKFQTFKANDIVSKKAPKADYQLKVTDAKESQYDMLKKLELDFDKYQTIVKYCDDVGIDFLSTPYNPSDVDFLETFEVSAYKIASGQLTEIPFLEYVAKKNKPIILSTGMGSLAEVYEAVKAIRESGNNDIIVMQCTTNYPSDIEDANINTLVTMKDSLQTLTGYSDHVPNNYACYAAVALGAKVIEKHFTLDREMNGPDHLSSLDIDGFEELIKGIRNVEKSLGDGFKRPTLKEQKNIYGMRRSLVALEDMEVGDIISLKNIGFKRPLNGLPVSELKEIVGKRISKKIKRDDPFTKDSIHW